MNVADIPWTVALALVLLWFAIVGLVHLYARARF